MNRDFKGVWIPKKGKLVCEWCGNIVYSLQEHQFRTLSKIMGGIETVKICGTCHSDYHHIQQFGIVKNKEDLKHE